MSHLFIRYKPLHNHIDPNFTHLTYGDSDDRKIAQILNKLHPGTSYVFFHTAIDKMEYVTAYFKVAKILQKDQNATEIEKLTSDSKRDKIVILGSRDSSKILTSPLPFSRDLVKNLPSLNIEPTVFDDTQTLLTKISSHTRMHRELTDEEKSWLINKCETRG